MNATIHLTDRDTKFIIHNLYPLYLHDLSEIWGWTPNAYGVFEDGPTLTLQEQNQEVAVWWEHPGVLYPYLIRADGIPAGFALVATPPYAPPGIDFYLNEFFVLRSFRGKGIAKSAAMQVFDTHAGAWELQTNPTEGNQRAQAFWRKTLQSYTAGAFRTHVGESGKDGVKWIFRFQNGGDP